MRSLTPWIKARSPRFLKEALVHLASFNMMEVTLHRLRAHGVSPSFIIDVGAYEARWARIAARVFPAVPILMVEANEEKRPGLERHVRTSRSPTRLEIALLGREERPAVPFYVMHSGSSIYEELSDFPRVVRQLPMTTLDALLGEPPPGPVLMKLDVQGAELDILQGAPRTLERTAAVVLEASVTEHNRGAPVLVDVVQGMERLGFRLWDVADAVRRPYKSLSCLDLMFLRAQPA